MLYSRASRHYRKFPHSYEHTKTFGSYLPLFASPLFLCHTKRKIPSTLFFLLCNLSLIKAFNTFAKRLSRAAATQESSRLNQKIFHLVDGPDQRARDDAMRAAMAAELEGRPIPDGNPNQWADRTKNHIQFDYDAYAEVDRWWASGGREQIEALGRRSDGGHGSSVRMAVKSRL